VTQHDHEGPADAGPSRVEPASPPVEPASPPVEPASPPDEPVTLERWDGTWDDEDPFAGLKADVVAYGHLDPLETLRGLSEASGVPVGALVRYVLARWATGGSDAVLELGVSGVDHLARAIAEAEEADTDEARLAAYAVIRDVVRWLRAEPSDG
jgi:hypothetical protein